MKSGVKLPATLPLDPKTKTSLTQAFANLVATTVSTSRAVQANTTPTRTTNTSRVGVPTGAPNAVVASPSSPSPTTLMNAKDISTALEFVMREDALPEPPQVTAAVIPLRYQAATIIAKTLGGSRISGKAADYKYAAGTPEVIINTALREFLRRAHMPEMWQNAGRMLQLAYQMNIKWDSSILKANHRKIMGLT